MENVENVQVLTDFSFQVSAFFDVLFKSGGRAVTSCKNKASVRAQPRTEHIFQNKSRNLKIIGRISKFENWKVKLVNFR